MEIACLDLEGVLIPEIWIAFAEKTGIAAFKRTTRDEPDYDVLMQYRLDLLRENGLGLNEIQEVIATLEPLDGAVEFVNWLRERFQVIILSDTFYEFAQPLMKKLDYPTLFCHKLITDDVGNIISYKLRQNDQKTKAVAALQGLNFQVISAGDSYNDTGMLQQADAGILFCPPERVVQEFPQFPVARNYDEFRVAFTKAKKDLESNT